MPVNVLQLLVPLMLLPLMLQPHLCHPSTLRVLP
jgi:hypothetical protein